MKGRSPVRISIRSPVRLNWTGPAAPAGVRQNVTTEGRIRSRILLTIYSLPRLRLLRRALQDCAPDDVNQSSRVKGWHDEVLRSALQHVDIELDIDETRYHDYRWPGRYGAGSLKHVRPAAIREGCVR